MAETILAATEPSGSDPALPLAAGSADLREDAADVVNDNSYQCTGRELVIAHNTDAAAQTLTVSSSADEHHRTGDITAYSIAAGKTASFGPFRPEGWARADGTVKLTASSVNVKLSIVRLPAMG